MYRLRNISSPLFWAIGLLLILLAACTPYIAPPSAATPPVGTATPATGSVEVVWGIAGGAEPFSHPTEIVVDAQNNLYVVDDDHHQIQKFDTNGKFLTKWGSKGAGDGQFFFRDPPSHWGAVAIDAQGHLYVTDHNERIQKFDDNGKFLGKWGAPGTGDGQFTELYAIAVDRLGNVYAADDNRVQKFDAAGKFLNKLGGKGTGAEPFGVDMGLAVDSQNNVDVVDGASGYIQKFDSRGKLLLKWGGLGSGSGKFGRPLGIAVDAHDNVYVTDNENWNVQKFDSKGVFITMWGEKGTKPGQFSYPGGITIDGQGNVYVVEVLPGRVQKFRQR